MKISDMLMEENTGSRPRLGSGKPGLNVLLGGTVVAGEEEIGTFSGAGAVSNTYRLAQAYKDVRMAAVAAPATSGPVMRGGAGGTTSRRTYNK